MNNTEDLHGFIQKDTFKNAFICTYSFETDFFENYCLNKFQPLKKNRNINVLVDYKTYSKIVNHEKLPELANIRYLLLPVKLPGAFHPKIFLFTKKDKAKLVIGSANFTEAGITSNAELVSCFEFEKDKKEESKDIFIQAYKFLEKIVNKLDNNKLKLNLLEILNDLPWLNEKNSENMDVKLIDNTEETLFKQIAKCKKLEVKEISVLSRFFSENPNYLIDKIKEYFNTSNISIYTQDRTSNLNKNWFDLNLFKDNKLKIFSCKYSSEDSYQTLHAKAYAIKYKDNSYTFAFGSANFSTTALLKTWDNGNLETLLLFENLKEKEINPDSLFSMESKKQIKNFSDLTTSSNADNQEDIYDNDFFLLEANFSENTLVLTIDEKKNLVNKKFNLLLVHYDNNIFTIEGKIQYINKIQIIISDFDKYLFKKSCILQLEIYEEETLFLTSNKILVTNLLDINNSDSYIKSKIPNIEENPEQFSIFIKELIENNDQDSLIYFFELYNVKLNPIYSLNLRATSTYSIISSGSLRDLNFNTKKDIHESAKSFIDRHIKKLESHTKNYRGKEGIRNFIQILFVILETIFFMSQIIFDDLNSKDETILTPEEWKEYKDIIYSYYLRLEKPIEIFSNDYFNKLMKKNIKNLESILTLEILTKILNLFETPLSELKKIIELRETKIFVLNTLGKKITPSDIVPIVMINLNLANHTNFETKQINKIKEVEKKLFILE